RRVDDPAAQHRHERGEGVARGRRELLVPRQAGDRPRRVRVVPGKGVELEPVVRGQGVDGTVKVGGDAYAVVPRRAAGVGPAFEARIGHHAAGGAYRLDPGGAPGRALADVEERFDATDRSFAGQGVEQAQADRAVQLRALAGLDAPGPHDTASGSAESIVLRAIGCTVSVSVETRLTTRTL